MSDLRTIRCTEINKWQDRKRNKAKYQMNIVHVCLTHIAIYSNIMQYPIQQNVTGIFRPLLLQQHFHQARLNEPARCAHAPLAQSYAPRISLRRRGNSLFLGKCLGWGPGCAKHRRLSENRIAPIPMIYIDLSSFLLSLPMKWLFSWPHF